MIAIYDRDLSEQEIAQNLAAGPVALPIVVPSLAGKSKVTLALALLAIA